MNNHKNIKPIIYDKPKPRTNRNKSNSVLQDSDSSAKSPNSVSSISDPRNCVFTRDTTGYGFKITGNAPVKIVAVRLNGSAWNAGLRENDTILKVNGESVIEKMHADVVELIRKQTRVELLVKSGDPIPFSNFTHNPTKTSNPISPPITKRSRIELVKPQPNPVKPSIKPLLVSDIASPKDNLSPTASSQNNLSDQSRRSTESIRKSSDSSSECSISTSSTETDSNSLQFDKNKFKPQNTKPDIAIKQNVIESDCVPNKNTREQMHLFKLVSPPGKDSPIKSHSYNAPSNKSSKLFQDSKKSLENPKNKTIPSDGVKSNNMLSSDRDNNEFKVPPNFYSTLPKKPNKQNHVIRKSKSISNNGLMLGREFDADNKQEDEDSDESLTIVDLLSSENAKSRSGIVAVLLQNLNDQINDLNIMMLYYACKFYKSFEHKKTFSTDAPRLANEIITTFILEKSPLFVKVESEIVDDILKTLKSTENINSIFDSLLDLLLQCLDDIVDKLKGRIQRGILLKSIPSDLGNEENREIELGLLHKTLCDILNKNSKDADPNDYTIAKSIGLATIFQYFYKPSFLQSGYMRSRSTDGINTLGSQGKLLPISDLFKVNLFCSAYQQKMSSSIRKKPKTISGHIVIDAACTQPENCGACENLLWGPSPQGWLCTTCQTYFHVHCKKKIKSLCSRKSRKSIIISGNKEEKPPTTLFGRLSRKSSTTSVKNINSQSTIEINTNVGTNIFNNNSLVPDDKTSASTFDENGGVFKAKSEDQLHRINSNPERNGSINNVPSLSYNHSMDSTNIRSAPINSSSTVQIQELVQDESIDDPDMKVDESFDAGAEIQAVFPKIDPGTDKKRLIVLLEFYHKTRYILMNLKRFLYKLVGKWPMSQFMYFKALSLDCIQPFVNLIKSLVNTIESCIEEQGFVDLEKAVFNWLSENNDKRLKEWITLSSNLCCTNSLNIVKQLKQTTMRMIPELISLLNVKMHKMVIVEELTQIRPLLISLPLIVKNIIKCFTKSDPQYPEQLSIWKDVSIKMDYLCEYIDRCCIPLVDWINNGSISKRVDRADWFSRIKEIENIDPEIINYCIDFPRTLFHFPIFDFQMAKIFSWSRNIQRLKVDFRIDYLKKGTEVLLIYYKSLIVVLQKENDHYYLKPIKPFKNITERLMPIIEINGFLATNGGQEEEFHILNIINKNPEEASLVRVGFTRREFVDNWLDYFINDNHNLARSISLYKLNDIKEISNQNVQIENNNASGAKLKSSDSFSNAQPTIIPSVSSTPVQPEMQIKELSVEPIVHESEILSKEIILPTELIEGLTIAVATLYDQKPRISNFLNINEEHYDNALELVTNQGPKTLEDMTLMFYSLCCPVVDFTRQLVIAGTDKNTFDIDNLKKTLTCISNLFHDTNLMNYLDDVNHNVKENMNISKSDERKPVNLPSSLSRIELNSNLSPLGDKNEMTPNEIIDEVKEIIDEIIDEIVDKSDDQIQHQPIPVMQQSYKYVPEKCLISASVDNVERSSLTLTPTYHHLTNLIGETITTTRAQIILSRSSNNSV